MSHEREVIHRLERIERKVDLLLAGAVISPLQVVTLTLELSRSQEALQAAIDAQPSAPTTHLERK